MMLLFTFSARADQNGLNFLFGSWEGQSHQTNRDGTVTDMKASECVYPKHAGQAGSLGIVEGRHVSQSTGELLFGTYAVLSPIDQSGQYRFSIYLNDGTQREATAQIDSTQQRWVWSMDLPRPPGSPQISIRYTINISSEGWTEVGETTKDAGANWQPFFNMKLKKTSDACTGF
jgi:hypothetical protein